MGNIARWTLVVIVPYSFIPMAAAPRLCVRVVRTQNRAQLISINQHELHGRHSARHHRSASTYAELIYSSKIVPGTGIYSWIATALDSSRSREWRSRESLVIFGNEEQNHKDSSISQLILATIIRFYCPQRLRRHISKFRVITSITISWERTSSQWNILNPHS